MQLNKKKKDKKNQTILPNCCLLCNCCLLPLLTALNRNLSKFLKFHISCITTVIFKNVYNPVKTVFSCMYKFLY